MSPMPNQSSDRAKEKHKTLIKEEEDDLSNSVFGAWRLESKYKMARTIFDINLIL